MTHLPYIIPSYAIGILLPLALAISAALRLNRAKQRLETLGTRRRRDQ